MMSDADYGLKIKISLKNCSEFISLGSGMWARDFYSSFSLSPSKNFDALIFFIPSGCRSLYGAVSTRGTSKKSRVTINNYEKLLQIYISELLNLTGSLGQLSELTLLCCSGCGCVPGTAHQHFLYDPPLRPRLCFLPCHRSNLCCFPCSGVLLSQQWFAPDTEMNLRWLMRESFNTHLLPPLQQSEPIRMVVDKLGNFVFWGIWPFDQEK